MKARASQSRFFLLLKSHVVRSESRRDYPAGITTVVIISIEHKSPKTGSLQAAIPKLSPGPKKAFDVSSDFSKNWSFSENLTDKGSTTLVITKEFLVFFKLGGQR